MSIFECKNGHVMNGHNKCSQCGEGVSTMDGISNMQWREYEKCRDISSYDEYLLEGEPNEGEGRSKES